MVYRIYDLFRNPHALPGGGAANSMQYRSSRKFSFISEKMPDIC
jgi:hypothetical protein